MKTRGVIALTSFAFAITAANWLTTHYGLVPMGFGLTATAGTYAAGAALLLRDVVQDLCGWRWALAGIAVGAVLTALTSPSLALASTVAFAAAELLDWGVYSPLRRLGWEIAAFASGCVGALADTLLFLWIAPFPVTFDAVSGQMVGKAFWATALPVAAVLAARMVHRAVPRHSLGA